MPNISYTLIDFNDYSIKLQYIRSAKSIYEVLNENSCFFRLLPEHATIGLVLTVILLKYGFYGFVEYVYEVTDIKWFLLQLVAVQKTNILVAKSSKLVTEIYHLLISKLF